MRTASTSTARPPRHPAPCGTIDIGTGWGAYGGDPGGHRYSQAQQITPNNVHRLALAWQYRTGEERWRFDPQIDLGQDPANQFICRGVAHWRDAVLAFALP